MKTYRLTFVFSSGKELVQEVKADSPENALKSIKDGEVYTFVDKDDALIQANMENVDYVRVKEY
ncbi:hypothetical protein RG959_23270 [Domibacillus sp. 8LH]|uniref:hypothetical protein n=1 Tax=Domibacillus sp. 8LH TaxID=3073900 RepID=UPI00317C04F9